MEAPAPSPPDRSIAPTRSLSEVLNDFERNRQGRFQLPNLLHGRSLEVVLRLKVQPRAARTGLLQLRLAWNDPRTGERRKVLAGLQLPQLPGDELLRMAPSAAVKEAVVLLEAARAKREAVQALDQGDASLALDCFERSKGTLLALPSTPATHAEVVRLEELARNVRRGASTRARKHSTSQVYNRQRSKADPED